MQILEQLATEAEEFIRVGEEREWRSLPKERAIERRACIGTNYYTVHLEGERKVALQNVIGVLNWFTIRSCETVELRAKNENIRP